MRWPPHAATRALVGCFVLLVLVVRWEDLPPLLVGGGAALGGLLLLLATAWDRP